ncbi:hypothetical protein ACFFUB_11170 [Algimonas porphyrae]|uniref:Uncharacterized protein n=1 Tax=Algimonas porphyrae TaxID=1128113 RepID=A0ABQ5V414_9PROT|nr:hypothetical protein [Algimonas porphyrae]GLQ21321.1 hypothetical protein GCM10007854_22760 [Algimonas porphyrae]
MPDLDPQITTLPVDTQIDGDAYMPGLSNPVTADEITDIYTNPQTSVQQRRDALTTLRQEMVGRDSADLRQDTKALIAAIDEGLSYLSEQGDGFAAPDVLRQADTAVDPDNL